METSPGRLTAESLLQLMWLASPALPVGGFSYSEGLEAAVDSGAVHNESSASAWLLDQLALGLTRCELPVFAEAFRVWQSDPRTELPRLVELNDWFTVTRETGELRQQAQQMGRSLVEWMRNRGEVDERVEALKAFKPAPTWPIAFALAAAQTGAARREALLSYGFGWAENMVQAALKAVPLGQLAGQRVLAALTKELPAAIDRAMSIADAERQAFMPMLAILSSQHETQYSRLFRS